MLMNWSKTLSRFVGVSTAVVAFAATALAQPATEASELTAETKAKVLEKLEVSLNRQAFVPGVDFSKWNEMIAAKQDELDDAKTATRFATVVNSVLREYGFSHISLFTPEYGTQRQTQQRGGIGIRIQIEEEGVRVTNVFPDSPASDAGLQPGDLIVESDGVKVKGVEELAGDIGDKSTLKVMRDSKEMKFEVVRRTYKTVIPESVEWTGTTQDIAVLKIPTFDVGYNQENVEKLFSEIRPKAKGVVLDLRGNGGGRVVNLQHLAGHFLDAVDEPIGTFIGRREVTLFEANNEPTTDVIKIASATKSKVRSARFNSSRKQIQRLSVPVTVLIDGGSGSASEMMAKALQEYRGAKLIGMPSAGAVLASVIVPLGDDAGGFWVQYPMFDYVTIKGYRIEGNRIMPDIEAPIARFGQPDEAVVSAVSVIRSMLDPDSAKATSTKSSAGTGDGSN